MGIDISRECIHCGQCTKNCSFLRKYNIDLQGFEQREELAYNCFLCGKCKLVCPKDIDGREIAIKMREKEVSENNGKLKQKGYSAVVLEKKNYLFKNYNNIKYGVKCDDSENINRIVFTGCNFLSYLPDTAEEFFDIAKKLDIGVAFDCCGKPILELGLKNDSDRIIEGINSVIEKENIQEVIMVCPNCYYFLDRKLNARLVDVFTFLEENKEEIEKVGKSLNMVENPLIFRPCPDRESNRLLNSVKAFVNGEVDLLNEQCCGAGGCASVKEPFVVTDFRNDIRNQVYNKHRDSMYTYCATCTGIFNGDNVNTKHLLSHILGVEESCVGNSLLNRMKFKFKKI